MPINQATLDWANWWYDFSSKWLLGAGLLAAFAAVVTILLAFMQWKSELIRAAHTEWRTSVIEAETAQANRAAAEANVRAASIEAEAERLRQSSLQLQLSLESERAERLRLEEKVKPRTISPEQETIILESLTGKSRGLVYVVPDWGDAEAKLFASKIASILARAGFEVVKPTGEWVPLTYGKLGIFFVIKDAQRQPPQLRPLYDAFQKAGFAIDIHPEDYVPETSSVMIGISSK